MRVVITVLLAASAVLAQNGAKKLVIEVDGKATPPFRARVLDGNAWISVEAVRQALGLDVKRETPGGPITVCRDDLCFVGPKDAMTEDGREVELDAVLDVVSATVKLKVLAPNDPMRYVVSLRPPEVARPTRALVKPGEPFPDVALERLDGGRVRLSSFRGRKLVMVNWASW